MEVSTNGLTMHGHYGENEPDGSYETWDWNLTLLGLTAARRRAGAEPTGAAPAAPLNPIDFPHDDAGHDAT